jgi:hypothetical protein
MNAAPPSGLTSASKQLCFHYTGTVAQGGSLNKACDTSVIGRHLTVQVATVTSLSLCEVEVFGEYRKLENTIFQSHSVVMSMCK